MSLRFTITVVVCVATVLSTFAGCSDSATEVDFECTTHEECLDGEACINELCAEAPTGGDECSDEDDGVIYQDLLCHDRTWMHVDDFAGPTIESIEAVPATAAPDETIVLRTEVDSEVEEKLEFLWVSPDEGWELIDSETSPTELVASAEYGESTTVELTVTDPFERSDSGEIIVSTHENDGPQIESIDVEPQPALPNQIQQIDADVEHPQNLELTYNWSTSGDWTKREDNGESLEVRAPDYHEAEGNVVLDVTDGGGGSAEASVFVSTPPNPGPEIEALTADRTVIEPDTETDITADALHELGYDLSYEWFRDDPNWGLTKLSEGNIARISAPSGRGEDVEITVEAEDDYEETGSESIAVETNMGPMMVAASAEDDSPLAPSETRTLTAEATHPQGLSFDILWSVDNDDWTVEETGTEVTIEAPAEPMSSTVEVTAEAEDELGVVSAPETIELRTLDYEPDPFSFTDVDGVEPHIEVESDLVEVTGFEAELTGICNGCQVRRENDESYADQIDGVQPGDTLQIRTESGTYDQALTPTLELGETPGDWTVTTRSWNGVRTFANCQNGGSSGPTQGDCDSAYQGELLEGNVDVDTGIQHWTAPADGIYRIEAWGASGGTGLGSIDPPRGEGARIRGDIQLEAGDELQILVGQRGTVVGDMGTTTIRSVSGGGGTFVVDESGDPLIVAGGGGGTFGWLGGDRHGQTSTAGGDGVTQNGSAGSGGTDGNEGESTSVGRGGAGFQGSPPEDYDANSFQQNGEGGTGMADGGFGGGGPGREGTESGDRACGGGGGYSGGGGALAKYDSENNQGANCAGGGGGSYNAGDNPDEQSGVRVGHGRVQIDWIAP